MSTLTTVFEQRDHFPAIWRRLVETHRWLALSAVVYIGLFVATIVLSIVDTRLVTGAPVWFKPMKFAISTAVYSITLVWMLSYVQGHRRLVNMIGSLTVLGFVVELAAIFIQASRGVRSHFNNATSFDAALFSAMGVFVMVIWVMGIVAAVLLLRQKFDDPVLAWSLRLGLLVTAVGAGLGYLMTVPTPVQAEQLAAGETLSIIGAHSVGVEDGGPGMPFTGWSTEGGDVRSAHFIGLHALQMLPLLGFVVNRYGRGLNRKRRTALVWIGGLGYLGLVLIITWQALRGQPLIAPDALTLGALGALVAAQAVAAGVVIAKR